ncbi:hypothetical protein DVA67_001625 [Solirubrobacter sp. CPCC 204708]|nr:hypothetical protein [Solirubrobacter deserti]
MSLKGTSCLGLAVIAACVVPGAGIAQEPAPAPPIWTFPASIYPDLSAAPPEDVADANRLWLRSKASAAKRFPTVAAARKLGYKGQVSKIKRPKPFFFHLRNTKLHEDGRELDVRYPEAVVYWYDPPRPMILVAFMYRVHEGAEPAYARSVLPWHSHCDGWSVVMHTWFTNDLRSGIARKPPRPEFSATFGRDFGDPTPDSASGCQPRGHGGGEHDDHND